MDVVKILCINKWENPFQRAFLKIIPRSSVHEAAISPSSPSSPNSFSRESGEGEKTNYSTLYTLSQFVGEGAPI
jgi:hypothetical protein